VLGSFVKLHSLFNRGILGHQQLRIERLPRPVPRTIWIYWGQGLDQAPDIVRTCVASWQRMNPGWNVQVLSNDTISTYLNPDDYSNALSLVNLSDLLRLRLLRDHGGVWADATSYCTKPLDDWLLPLMSAGFFCFTAPIKGRTMANWFLASEKGGLIADRLSAAADDYWQGRDAANDYFWFHYMLDWLLLTDRRFRRRWRAMPKLNPDGPHAIFAATRAGMADKGPGPEIDLAAIPLHKLSWKEPTSPEALRKWGLDPAP